MSELPDVATVDVADEKASLPFPVVGIGASAGGLPALQRLFEHMPAKTGMAFVVILHLSPRHRSTADHVLQRVTRMPVVQVTDTVAIEPNHIYVIAPGSQLIMSGSRLGVGTMERPRGQHVAVDIFFRTLAESQWERALAIVLSGTGGDGAVGIARIKEKGGVVLVQSPGDAEHDGMPLAAIGTGLVDFILPVGEMPQKLIDLWANASQMALPVLSPEKGQTIINVEADESTEAEQALQRILNLLRMQSGHDFRQYKRATVLRRLERRMQVRAMPTLPDYQHLLETDANEHKLLLNDLLIGVTNFFRDREAFESLEREVMPALFRDRAASDEVRAWSAGCATGEEAYSVAMLLADQAALMTQPPTYQVFASDIDEHAIAVARSGAYPLSIVTDVVPARLRLHFTRDENRYRIRKGIRDHVLFTVHNLLRDPPFSRIDLITCRNLLIYLNRDIQQRVLETFHFALKPGGYLFLGSSESAEAVDELFVPVDKKNRIYRARATVRSLPHHRGHQNAPPQLHLPEPRSLAAHGRRQASLAEMHQRALAQFAPPSVLVDTDHNIVHLSERAAQYMRLIGGEPSRDILALVLPELRIDLRSALYQVQNSGQAVEGRQVSLVRHGRPCVVSISVRPFRDEEAAQDFLLVTFIETERPAGDVGRTGGDAGDDVVLTQLEAELQRKKQQLQETIEHAEVSNEELRAANEELQAINEELRSASEELETSKEELQSVNEELITVNYELKLKVEETSKANDDLNNLIAATDIATVFVDGGLRIKRFTPRAADIFSIIPSDTGRSLLDLTHRLDYQDLADDVAESFNALRMVEREVRSHDGRYYIVRLLPYRTTEDRIEGAVMTFFDITGRREAEEKLRAGEARSGLAAEPTRDDASAPGLKDEFLAIMAHELRHPLNLIHINVELLSRLPELRHLPAVTRSTSVIRNAVLGQAKLIDDLLDMSRVRTGKLSLSLAPVDLAPLVRDAVDAVRADPAASRLAITVEAETPGLRVLADSVRVEQVLMNLLSNAVKFTPSGGAIAVRLTEEDGSARIDVRDDGQGIAPDFLPHVFTMYAQPGSVTRRAKGGLGIGLALVREIVSLHGGRVEAHSDGVGKGACFRVWLPLLENAPDPQVHADAAPEQNIAGVRILLVDDVEEVVTACQALLEMHGAVVIGATSGQQALAILAEHQIDLLVSDISMPGMDGYALLKAARRLPRYARLPAIAVTGLARQADVAQAREAGFDAHVGKPMAVDRLTEIIRELLPKRQPEA